MNINRIALKRESKVLIAAARPSPVAITFGYIVIVYIISGLQTRLDERFTSFVKGIWMFMRGAAPWPAFHFSSVMLFSALFIILLRIISSVLTTGYQWYSLRLSRSLNTSFSNIFDPMNTLFKVVGLTIAIAVLTFLWSLLFIIPGIVAGYSYRQAYYILYDHPEYGILQCIRESRRMMRGYKLDLFVLDLSFLGWYIVCGLTLGILFIWKMPYFEVTYAGYYNALRAMTGYGPGAEQSGGDPWDRPL
ncbi:MAG: DUF975 family protein [Clostridiales bacterium]|nr:DUF975 family protein [Clostridiales bacterium]